MHISLAIPKKASLIFNDAAACDNKTIAGVTDFSSEEIILYLNPVTKQLILKIPAETFANRIIILDIHDRSMKDESIP